VLICRIVGHRRQHHEGPRYYRRGRWHTPTYFRCTRCGTSDGGEVWRRGWAEWLTWSELRRAAYWWRVAFREWRGQTCVDCGKPTVRFGRAVGDHSGCEVIPF
jgi:hypothetical protein